MAARANGRALLPWTRRLSGVCPVKLHAGRVRTTPGPFDERRTIATSGRRTPLQGPGLLDLAQPALARALPSGLFDGTDRRTPGRAPRSASSPVGPALRRRHPVVTFARASPDVVGGYEPHHSEQDQAVRQGERAHHGLHKLHLEGRGRVSKRIKQSSSGRQVVGQQATYPIAFSLSE